MPFSWGRDFLGKLDCTYSEDIHTIYSSNSALYPWMRMGDRQSYVFKDTKAQKEGKKKKTTDPGENRDNSRIKRDFFLKLLISFKRLWKTLICKTKIDCHVREVKRNNFHINRII